MATSWNIPPIFQPQNINTLCASIVNTAQQKCPELVAKSRSVSDKFSRAFHLFRECHELYDTCKQVEGDTITKLSKPLVCRCSLVNSDFTLTLFIGSCIDDFLSYYRTTFPDATTTPKLHMLEDHLIPWMERWQIDVSFHGEQGAESIHTMFNSLDRVYSSMPNRLERLTTIVKEHHLTGCSCKSY